MIDTSIRQFIMFKHCNFRFLVARDSSLFNNISSCTKNMLESLAQSVRRLTADTCQTADTWVAAGVILVQAQYFHGNWVLK